MKNDWIREGFYEYNDAGPSQYSYAPPVKSRQQKPGRLFNWLFQTVPENKEVMPRCEANVPVKQAEDPLQAQRIQEALRAWKDSIAFFENVSDPALIDYAVYDMEAAQKRYMFLLKNVRDYDRDETVYPRR